MHLRYYDSKLGRDRIKRRYLYAAWAFGCGLLFGLVIGHLL